MHVEKTALDGVLLIEPEVYADERGYFLETHRAERYPFADPFVQDNLSCSRRGVIRGLHLQWPDPQGKLVYVVKGEVFDVVVDLRRGSSTYARWEGHKLSERNHRQVWIPPGFAHGFAVRSDQAWLAYKCTRPYAPQSELTIRYDDPDLAIGWPVEAPALSEKDAAAPRLAEIDPGRLPD